MRASHSLTLPLAVLLALGDGGGGVFSPRPDGVFHVLGGDHA
jgi:hypothetical protein